ncbi:MAG: hypothetical protein ACP5UM_00845 [Anaerolineae bacterium]
MVHRRTLSRPKRAFDPPGAVWLRGPLRDVVAEHLDGRRGHRPLWAPLVLAQGWDLYGG